MMRDQVLVGADVAQAVRGCVGMAPAPIAGAVATMAQRLQVDEPGEVLIGFAAEVNDPMAELLAVSLRFALTRRTAKLADLFNEVARTTEEQVRTRRSIETERRRLRTAMWSVMTAVTAWLVGIYLVSGSYLAPYDGVVADACMEVMGELAMTARSPAIRQLAAGTTAPIAAGSLEVQLNLVSRLCLNLPKG
jgi:hypothetical protein